jgi:hypothetical protein
VFFRRLFVFYVTKKLNPQGMYCGIVQQLKMCGVLVIEYSKSLLLRGLGFEKFGRL